MTEPREFTCPKCGGHHFGSDTLKDESGNVGIGDMVTCQTVIDWKWFGTVREKVHCGYRCTRKDGGL